MTAMEENMEITEMKMKMKMMMMMMMMILCNTITISYILCFEFRIF